MLGSTVGSVCSHISRRSTTKAFHRNVPSSTSFRAPLSKSSSRNLMTSSTPSLFKPSTRLSSVSNITSIYQQSQRTYVSRLPRLSPGFFPDWKYRFYVHRTLRDSRTRTYAITNTNYQGPLLRSTLYTMKRSEPQVLSIRKGRWLRDNGNIFSRQLWTQWLHFNLSKSPLPNTFCLPFVERVISGPNSLPLGLFFIYLMMFQGFMAYYKLLNPEVLQSGILLSIYESVRILHKYPPREWFEPRSVDQFLAKSYARSYPLKPLQFTQLRENFMKNYDKNLLTPLSSFYRSNINSTLFNFHHEAFNQQGNVGIFQKDIRPIHMKYYPKKYHAEIDHVPVTPSTLDDYNKILTVASSQSTNFYLNSVLHEALTLILFRSLYEQTYLNTLKTQQSSLHVSPPTYPQQSHPYHEQLMLNNGYILPMTIDFPELQRIREQSKIDFTPQQMYEFVNKYYQSTPMNGVYHLSPDYYDHLTKNITNPLFSTRAIGIVINQPGLLGNNIPQSQVKDIPDFYKPFYPYSNETSSYELSQVLFHCDRALSQLVYEINRCKNDMDNNHHGNELLQQQSIIVGHPNSPPIMTGVVSPILMNQQQQQQQLQQHHQIAIPTQDIHGNIPVDFTSSSSSSTSPFTPSFNQQQPLGYDFTPSSSQQQHQQLNPFNQHHPHQHQHHQQLQSQFYQPQQQHQQLNQTGTSAAYNPPQYNQYNNNINPNEPVFSFGDDPSKKKP